MRNFGAALLKAGRIVDNRLRPIAQPNPPERHSSGKMNKTETAYANHLEMLKQAREICWYGFEAVTLRLAKNTRYTPDFAVIDKDGRLVFIEVKGFWRDDARVKIKVANEMYPFRFVAVTKKRQKDGGGWNEERF